MLSSSTVRAEPRATVAPAALPRPTPVRGPIRLTRSRRLLVYGVAASIWATGAAWLATHYLLRAEGPFGPEPSPLEPWWLKLHGAAGFAALWTFGLLWAAHLVNGWSSGRRRWSGAVMTGAVLVLIATGYLLYYAGDDGVRSAVSVVHWGLGLGAPAAFVWHRFLARDRR